MSKSGKCNLIFSGIIIALGLGGCASNAKVSESDVNTWLNESLVVNIPAPVSLVEKTKARAIGNMVASSIAGSVAASSGNPGSMQQLQANQQIGSQFSGQLNQALPKGASVSKGGGVNILLASKIKDLFAAKPLVNPSSDVQVKIETPIWELEYVGLFSSNYKLNYKLAVELVRMQGNKPSILRTWYCEGASPELKSYEAWTANDYDAVNKEAVNIVDKCMVVLNKSGLH
ncbi:MAG TPA: hypothetical protein VN023_01125 [Methylovorus sp.]|jgi:hypothetical protein|nr:hypothetical protein [Methylovorus sp.]